MIVLLGMRGVMCTQRQLGLYISIFQPFSYAFK